MLGREVRVAKSRHLTLGAAEHGDEGGGGGGLGSVDAARERRQAADRVLGTGEHGRGVGADLLQDGDDEALMVTEKRRQQVRRGDFGIAALPGEPLGGADGLLGLDCEAIRLHWPGFSQTRGEKSRNLSAYDSNIASRYWELAANPRSRPGVRPYLRGD